MRRRTLLIALLAALASASLVLPAAAPAAERTVSVEATATIKVPNDSATVGLAVSLERSSRGAALRAVSGQLRDVIAAVGAIPGVGAGDIGVTLHEPARAGELVSAAIAAGATGVRGPTYFVGDTEAAYAAGLAAAFEKAKAKATTLATQAGAALGPALTINEGGNPEIIPFEDKAASAPACGNATASKRTAACGAPSPPTKPGVSTVTATVGVVFALQ
jgi:uncharacterized protein YggE